MKIAREHLDPSVPLAAAAAEWISRLAETGPEGAASLAHVLVAVPSAQSGRSLSLALARRFSPRGVVAPLVLSESELFSLCAGGREASGAEELSAFASALLDADLSSFPRLFPRPPAAKSAQWAVDAAGGLLGVCGVLCENALDVRDVQAAAEGDGVAPGFREDAPRWAEFALLEEAAAAILARAGKTTRCRLRKEVAARGCALDGVREIVLPAFAGASGALCKFVEASVGVRATVLVHAAAADAGKFDRYGRPASYFAPRLRPDRIHTHPGAAEEAAAVAAFFATVPENEAFPALVACDPEAWPALEGAFRNNPGTAGIELANPAPEPFARSALGMLLLGAVQLSRRRDYATFSTVLRSGDVARWAARRFAAQTREAPAAAVARAVGMMDGIQNAYLPKTAAGAVAAIAAAEGAAGLPASEAEPLRLLGEIAGAIVRECSNPWRFMREIFAGEALDASDPAHRELAAAAAAAAGLREECDAPPVDPRLRETVFEALLGRATYTLEHDESRALRAGGWIETQWKSEDSIVFTGLNENCVPETVAGHAFLPDSARELLGLETNERRAMRDSFILAEAAACRAPGAVTVHMRQTAADGTALKPSRIIFEGLDGAELPALARRLYTAPAEGGSSPGRALPRAWLLSPGIPPPGRAWRRRISVSSLDSYRECPFLFRMREVFGERSDDRAKELDAARFGELCHGALEDFSKSPAADSRDEGEIAAFLAEAVRRRLPAPDGGVSAIVWLQGRAAQTRLAGFARIQALRRRAGWRIAKTELRLECTVKQAKTAIVGRIDRVDEHEETGELAVIDYKTWNGADRAGGSLQLPLYRAMLQASGLFDARRAAEARAFYCILPENPDDALFDEEHAFAQGAQSEAEDEAARLLEGIADGVFWPPGPKSRWREEYGDIVWQNPAEGIDPEWIADQERRIAGRAGA